jgi:hypothetical protein
MPKASALHSIYGIAQAISASDFKDRIRALPVHDIKPKNPKASKR